MNYVKTHIDTTSFRELYDLYYLSICKYLNLYTKDVRTIEDIVQETFLKLWENRDVIEITYIKTYLFHTARNKMLNYLRDEQNHSLMLEKCFRRK